MGCLVPGVQVSTLKLVTEAFNELINRDSKKLFSELFLLFFEEVLMTEKHNIGYNERLFKKGLRGFLHNGRFEWIKKKFELLGLTEIRVVELGCFDGRLLKFLPNTLVSYNGYDADWEGGLSTAKSLESDSVKFSKCTNTSQFLLPDQFNVFISLETLEHINDENLLRAYLQKAADELADNGIALITVPNEIGPLFALKHLYKRFIHGEKSNYSTKEFFHQVLGQTSKVQRNEHKGFSYINFNEILKDYFEVCRVEGANTKFLPAFLNMSIGFSCKKLRQLG